jgi:hypothetical protein
MIINEQIKEILKEFNINESDGIIYLISLHLNLVTHSTIFPESFVSLICSTGIFYADTTGLNWKIPLFEEQETQWSWIKNEYIPMFKNLNKDRAGNYRDCVSRLKKIFSKYPEIRKEDVIAATKMYLRDTDREYIKTSHYFIEKGIGASKSSDLLEWVDRYKESLNETKRVTANTILR